MGVKQSGKSCFRKGKQVSPVVWRGKKKGVGVFVKKLIFMAVFILIKTTLFGEPLLAEFFNTSEGRILVFVYDMGRNSGQQLAEGYASSHGVQKISGLTNGQLEVINQALKRFRYSAGDTFSFSFLTSFTESFYTDTESFYTEVIIQMNPDTSFSSWVFHCWVDIDNFAFIEVKDAIIYSDGSGEGEHLLVLLDSPDGMLVAYYTVGTVYKNTAEVTFYGYSTFGGFSLYFYWGYGSKFYLSVFDDDKKEGTITVRYDEKDNFPQRYKKLITFKRTNKYTGKKFIIYGR